MSEYKVNSKDYWDNRFQTNWESFLGREQTEFFLNLLLENLPFELIKQLEEEKWSICDAGCAEGDGTNLLANKFNNLDVVGIDFSNEAISKAKEYYPNVDYAQGDIKNLPQNYDVIICSNVLEHFSNPFEIIPKMLQNTKQHLILMVPFLEDDRIKEHMYTFEYKSFPIEIDNFQLSYFKEIDCKLIEGTHWYGKQAIIIYSKKVNIEITKISLGNFNARNEFYEEEYFSQKEALETMKNKLVNNDKKLEEINNELMWHKDQIVEKEHTISWFKSTLENNNTILKNLSESYNQKDKFISNLLQDKNEFIQKIKEYERQITYYSNVNYDLNHQLTSFQNTKAWKILNKYYRFMGVRKNLKYYIKKFNYILKTKGLREAVSRSATYLNSQKEQVASSNSSQLINLYSNLLNDYEVGKIQGLVIIPSAFEFDELYNQRTINFAKYLAKKGFAVLYIAWQWEKGEKLENNYQSFLNNIYQVPLFDFLETDFSLINGIKNKKFIITFPAKEFNDLIIKFRENAFHIIYDIMDEWEGFYDQGESPWYKKEVEEAIILNSDAIFAVSEPLRSKFNYLRTDIKVVGNGYSEEVSKYKDISLKQSTDDKKIHIGYFGHMTAAWFDWELIFDIAKKDHIFIHLVGYGADDKTLEKIMKYNNIKYYGKIHPGKLHEVVEKWHIGIIPFKHSKLSEAVDPIKVYEYLYFGLPTISTGIPHLNNYPLVTHSESTKHFYDTIEKLYNEILEGKIQYSNVNEFLLDSTWDSRFNFIMDEINNNNILQELFD